MQLDAEDAESLEVLELVDNLTSKLSHRKQTAFSGVTTNTLSSLNFHMQWLDLKPDGEERARARGSMEVEGNFLTLKNTKSLITLIMQHVARSTEAGCRILTDILLLRLASVVSDANERLFIVPEFIIPQMQFNEKQSFGGIVDYLLAKYPAVKASKLLHAPQEALRDLRFRKIGSSNIFEAKTLAMFESGVPQCILAMASWCKQSDTVKSMRGAATDGEHWIFFAYRSGEKESDYARTKLIQVGEDCAKLDFVLGLLIDWVKNSEKYEPFEYFAVTA